MFRRSGPERYGEVVAVADAAQQQVQGPAGLFDRAGMPAVASQGVGPVAGGRALSRLAVCSRTTVSKSRLRSSLSSLAPRSSWTYSARRPGAGVRSPARPRTAAGTDRRPAGRLASAAVARQIQAYAVGAVPSYSTTSAHISLLVGRPPITRLLTAVHPPPVLVTADGRVSCLARRPCAGHLRPRVLSGP